MEFGFGRKLRSRATAGNPETNAKQISEVTHGRWRGPVRSLPSGRGFAYLFLFVHHPGVAMLVERISQSISCVALSQWNRLAAYPAVKDGKSLRHAAPPISHSASGGAYR